MKKITGDELPDFYNIVLERPKDDPDGYDVLFIDAAAKVGGEGPAAFTPKPAAVQRAVSCSILAERTARFCIECPFQFTFAAGIIRICRLARLAAPCSSQIEASCPTPPACPAFAGRAGQPHEPQLHAQLPSHCDGLQRAPHHRALHAAPGGWMGVRVV